MNKAICSIKFKPWFVFLYRSLLTAYRKELLRFLIEDLRSSPPCLLIIDHLSSYYTDLPDLYQTVSILKFTLRNIRQQHHKYIRVVMSDSTANIASFNKDTLAVLIPGQIQVTSHINPENQESYYSVSGKSFSIVKDPGGQAKLRYLEMWYVTK